MSLIASASIFMIEPLPNCFSIWDSAAANALDLLSSIAVPLFLGCRHLRQALSRWANTGYCINVQVLWVVDAGLSTSKNSFRRQNDGEASVPGSWRDGLSHGRPPAEKRRPSGHRL